MKKPEAAREMIPLRSPFRGEVHVGGSKSLAGRAIVAASLSDGVSVVRGILDASDIAVMAAGVSGLGATVEWRKASALGGSSEIEIEADEIRIVGLRPGEEFPAAGVRIEAEASGLAARFLTALSALSRGPIVVEGTERMKSRPMKPLVEALREMGCPIRLLSGDGLPVYVEGGGLRGGACVLGGASSSSQFLSALLLALTRARGESNVRVETPFVSAPYVEMTLSVARQFGMDIERRDAESFRVIPEAGRARNFLVEPDASSAGYAFAAAAITGGEVLVRGLSRSTLQPDIRFLDLLEEMGCEVEETRIGVRTTGGPLRGIATDLRDFPDSVPALAAAALFAEGPTEICGAVHLRHKESDRLSALSRELRRLGGRVEERPDGLVIHPSMNTLRGTEVETYDDHRIAMALALIGLRVPGVRVKNPGCVAKSFPGFWTEIGARAVPA